MISDSKPQNILLITTLIIGLISGVGLASNAAWYSGSYSIVRYLDVDMTDIRVANYNLPNMSLSVYFNVEAPAVQTGEAKLTYFTMSVYINGNKLSYTTFRKSVPLDLRTIYPAYNETFRIGSTIASETDQQLIIDAAESGEWVFSIRLTIFYDIFDSPGDQVRVVAYSYNGEPSGIDS